jgi:hypothetical protein
LCDACEYGDEHLAAAMIDASPWDVACKGKNMGLPLCYAAEQGQSEMVKILLACRAERALDFSMRCARGCGEKRPKGSRGDCLRS